jgi:hypothetical protein
LRKQELHLRRADRILCKLQKIKLPRM